MSQMSALPVPIGSATPIFPRERQAAFLAALAASGSVRSASASAGVSHQTAYRARLASPGLRRAWDAALLAARAQAEQVLASRALEGWEEEVIYHGEVVATRQRFSDRLLLAHLARLDRLCGDAEVAGFADSFDFALEQFAAGDDRPARKPEALARAAQKAAQQSEEFSSGERSRRSKRTGRAIENPCPDCGGRCLGPAEKLTKKDCQWLGNRFDRMEAARPGGVAAPHQFPGGDGDGAIFDEQLAAFEAGVEQWWHVVPPPEGADPEVWHFRDDDD